MSFASDLKRFAESTDDAIDKTNRAVTIKLFSAIVLDTPVLSGRLRGNWQTSLGSPITRPIKRIDQQGVVTEIIQIATSAGKKDTTIMRNNLPYAERIEYDGWSKEKAPRGMVRRNVARFKRLLSEEARRNKV